MGARGRTRRPESERSIVQNLLQPHTLLLFCTHVVHYSHGRERKKGMESLKVLVRTESDSRLPSLVRSVLLYHRSLLVSARFLTASIFLLAIFNSLIVSLTVRPCPSSPPTPSFVSKCLHQSSSSSSQASSHSTPLRSTIARPASETILANLVRPLLLDSVLKEQSVSTNRREGSRSGRSIFVRQRDLTLGSAPRGWLRSNEESSRP